ncbi:MAG TPA: VCBS repeat-containing protein [Melioribacteraceae bacterium]|nr:VCBS repeat-containing protein [Melioribacteraceae bacterium]
MKKLIVILISFITGTVLGQSLWKENSFKDFADGKFTDAGSNAYVSAKGRIQIISRWDFNNDGYLDIFLPTGHAHTEKENTYIYLNNGSGIDSRSRIQLPAAGSRDGLIADFNKDGFNDLAVVNFNDSHARRIPAWIYFGSQNGFSANNRIELPAADGTSIAAGDFNGDSWLDLAIGCQFWDEKDSESAPRKSFIYFNSSDGFKKENSLALSFNGTGAVALESDDIDKDGIDDLVFMTKENLIILLSSKDSFADISKSLKLNITGTALSTGDFNGDDQIDIAVCSQEGVTILKNSGDAVFNLSESILLKVNNPSDVSFADFDNDGFDDLFVANLTSVGGGSWTDSYLFYSDGKGFSSRKPALLPTLGASGVSCGDLNNDEFPEIVVSNRFVTNQKNLLSYVFWNDKGKFFFENHTQLPTQGTYANTIGDANNDGLQDVIFFNDYGWFSDGPSISNLYWGDGTRNFSESRTTKFNTHEIFGFGNADLDDDGNVEIIMASQAFKYAFIENVAHDQASFIIKWNINGKFEEETFLTTTFGYGGVRIADINRDGYLDILGSGSAQDLTNPGKYGLPIYWGSQRGFSFNNRTVILLSTPKIRGPLLKDFNKDGWLDIAGQIEFGKVRFWWGDESGFSNLRISDLDLGRKDELMYLKAADFNKDGWLDLFCPKRGAPEGDLGSSFLYYGSAEGFSNRSRIEIPTYVAYQNCFADLNKDGWLDMFITSYGGEVSGNRPSLVYYGSKDGFVSEADKIETLGPSGVELLDYDGDGWLDALVANHRKSGSYFEPEPHNHSCDSFLYWGSPDGFSKKNRIELPAQGPFGLNLRDPGNSYDRGFYEDYFSSIYQVNSNEIPAAINWKAETPFGTEIHLQIRTSDMKEDIEKAEWIGPNGKNSWFKKSGSKIKNVYGNFIQYRARLITPDCAASPYLTEVEISFSKK